MMYLALISLPAWLLVAAFPRARNYWIAVAAFAGWRIGDAAVRDPHFVFAFSAAVLVHLPLFSLIAWLALLIGGRFRADPARDLEFRVTWRLWRSLSFVAIAFLVSREIGARHDVADAATTVLLQGTVFCGVCALVIFMMLNSDRQHLKVEQDADRELARFRESQQ